jgi:triacylglycerol lipase
MKIFMAFIIALLLLPPLTSSAENLQQPVASKGCVILLHGLARSASSFDKMAASLSQVGYRVINVDYPSRKQPVETLATRYVSKAVAECNGETTHFVTHSMGGILVRYYLANNRLENPGKVVMLSPPNQGSEVVDKLGDVPGFYAFNGPAGQQLGTADDSLPNQLGPVDYPVGIITGNRSINLILSMLIPGDDDGKVSIERAKLEGMTDFLVVPHTHPMIMDSDEVIRQTRYFLINGRFDGLNP